MTWPDDALNGVAAMVSLAFTVWIWGWPRHYSGRMACFLINAACLGINIGLIVGRALRGAA